MHRDNHRVDIIQLNIVYFKKTGAFSISKVAYFHISWFGLFFFSRFGGKCGSIMKGLSVTVVFIDQQVV